MAPTVWEVAYSAGLFDGEGSIHVGERSTRAGGQRHTLQIQVANTNRSVLEWFKARWGGSIYEFKGQDRRGHNWSRCWSWGVNNAEAKRVFLEAIYPFLIIKKRPAEIALEFLKIRAPLRGHDFPPAALARRHELFLQYRETREADPPAEKAIPMVKPQLSMELAG